MQKYQNSYAGPTGIVIAGAAVSVTKADGSPATIYSDNGVTPITSLVTARDGEFAFYAANGTYTITLRKFGLRDEVVTGVLLYDPMDGGADTLGFKPAGAGAVTRNMQDRLRETVSPADYSTLQDALNTGKLVRLVDGVTYPVITQLLIPSGGGIIGKGVISVSSLDFGGAVAGPSPATIPILAQNVSNITLRDFKVQVSASQNSVIYPVALRGVVGAIISDTEFTGLNGGAAIKVDSCKDVKITRPYVHDCQLDRSSTGQLTAVEIDNDKIANTGSQRVSVIDPCFRDLTVTPAFLAAYGYQTDGVNIQTGASACSVVGGMIDNVGEGVDLFCDDSMVSGTVIRNAYIFGVKLVHGASRNLIDSVRVINPGLGGVTIGGSSTATKDTDRNTVSNVHVSGVNSTGAWNADTPYAFGTGNDGTFKATNTLFRSNRCTQSPNAKFNVSLGGSGAGNQAVDCSSDGTPQADLNGSTAACFRRDRVGDASGLAYIGGTNARLQWDSTNLRLGGFATNTRYVDFSQNGVETQRFDDNGATTMRSTQNYGVAAAGQGMAWLYQMGTGGVLGGSAMREQLLSTDTWADSTRRATRYVVELSQAGLLVPVTEADPAKGLSLLTAGQGLRIKEGSNAKQGVATLSGGAVTVPNTSVTASSRIMLTAQDNNTTGSLRTSARTAGTNFTITSSNASDSGVVAYQIFEPA